MGVTNMPSDKNSTGYNDNEEDFSSSLVKKVKKVKKTVIRRAFLKKPKIVEVKVTAIDEVKETAIDSVKATTDEVKKALFNFQEKLNNVEIEFFPFFEILEKNNLSTDMTIDESFQKMKELYLKFVPKIGRESTDFNSKEEYLEYISELEKDLQSLIEEFNSSDFIKNLKEVHKKFGSLGIVKINKLSSWESMLDEHFKKALEVCRAISLIKEEQFDVLKLGIDKDKDIRSLRDILDNIKNKLDEVKNSLSKSPLSTQYAIIVESRKKYRNLPDPQEGFELDKRETLALFSQEIQILEKLASADLQFKDWQLILKEYHDLVKLKTALEEFQSIEFTQPEKKEITEFEFDMLTVIFKNKIEKLSEMMKINHTQIKGFNSIYENLKNNKQAILKFLEQLDKITPTQLALLRQMDPQDKNFSCMISKTKDVISYLRDYPDLFFSSTTAATDFANRLEKRFLSKTVEQTMDVFTQEIQELSRLEIHPLRTMKNKTLQHFKKVDQLIQRFMSVKVDDITFSSLLIQLDEHQKNLKFKLNTINKKFIANKQLVEKILRETGFHVEHLKKSDNLKKYSDFRESMLVLKSSYISDEKKLKELINKPILDEETIEQVQLKHAENEFLLSQIYKTKPSIEAIIESELKAYDEEQKKLKEKLPILKQRCESYQSMLSTITEKISKLGDAKVLEPLRTSLKINQESNSKIKTSIDHLMEQNSLNKSQLDEVGSGLNELYISILAQEKQLKDISDTRSLLEQSYSKIKGQLKDFFILLDDLERKYHNALISNDVFPPHFNLFCEEIDKVIRFLSNSEIDFNKTEVERIICDLKSRYSSYNKTGVVKNSEGLSADKSKSSRRFNGISPEILGGAVGGIERLVKGVRANFESPNLPAGFSFLGQENNLFSDVSQMDTSMLKTQLEEVNSVKVHLPMIQSFSKIKLSILYDSYIEQVNKTKDRCDQQISILKTQCDFLEDKDKNSMQKSFRDILTKADLPLANINDNYSSFLSLDSDDPSYEKIYKDLTENITNNKKKLSSYNQAIDSCIKNIENKRSENKKKINSLHELLLKINFQTDKLYSNTCDLQLAKEKKYKDINDAIKKITNDLKEQLTENKAKPLSLVFINEKSALVTILKNQNIWLSDMIDEIDASIKIKEKNPCSPLNPHKKSYQEAYKTVNEIILNIRVELNDSKSQKIDLITNNMDKYLSNLEKLKEKKEELDKLSKRRDIFEENSVRSVLVGYEYLLNAINQRYLNYLDKQEKKNEERLYLESSSPEEFKSIHDDFPVFVELYRNLNNLKMEYITKVDELIDKPEDNLIIEKVNDISKNFGDLCEDKLRNVSSKLKEKDSQKWYKIILAGLKVILEGIYPRIPTFFPQKPSHSEYVSKEADEVMKELNDRLGQNKK